VKVPALTSQEVDLPIPANYVRTPNGYFHPSCVVQVEDDEVLFPGEKIRRPDGSDRTIAPCAYPALDLHGHPLDGLVRTNPSVSGWQMDAELDNVTVSEISASWTVPNTPTNTGASPQQVIYFFPGLEPSDQVHILQPVLGWNASDQPGTWSIQSWLCCDSTWNTYKSAGLAAQGIGDTITGYAQGSNCSANTGVCSNWQVSTSDINGASTISTTLNIGSPVNPPDYSKVVNYSYGGVLEMYYLSHCTQLPPDDSMTFSSVTILDINGSQITSPSWTRVIYDYAGAPHCLYSLTTTNSSVTLSWDHLGCDPGWTDCGSGEAPRCVLPPESCP